MLITVKYNPQAPTHKRATQVNTDDYGDSQLLDMLGATGNAEYVEDKSFVGLAREIVQRVGTGEDGGDWYVLFHHLDTGVIKNANKVFQKLAEDLGLLSSPFTEVAGEYVQGLLLSLAEGVEFILDLERAALAIQLVGNKSTDVQKLRKMLAPYFQAQQQAKQEREKDEILKSGRSFLQLGAYFGSEIPIERAGVFRRNFFELLRCKAQELETLRGQDLRDMPPKRMLTALEEIKKELKDSASRSVERLSDTRRAQLPTTFEETLGQDLQHRIRGLRQRVQMILEPVAVLIHDVYPGARLLYRGSLTDGVKNYTKSQSSAKLPEWNQLQFGNKATHINVSAFDVDAFIELPNALWDRWLKFDIIPDRKDQAIKGKIILEAWIPMLEKLAHQRNVAAYCELPKIRYLQGLETILQAQLMLLDGYKQNQTRAEFEMVLQPKRKTESAKKYGKPYKLGELSRSGSAYQELMSTIKSLKDEGLDEDGAWIEETHMLVAPRYTSVARAEKILTGRAAMRYKVLDLSATTFLLPKDIEVLVQAIEDGYLPFLTDLHLSSSSLTKEQRKRIWDVLPVKIHLKDQTTLNF